ncbi:hypothetical protein HaLaN_04461, partial [Haematococcus lacustris]
TWSCQHLATPPIEPPTPLTIRDNGFSGLISARIYTRIEASECGRAQPHAELVGHVAGMPTSKYHPYKGKGGHAARCALCVKTTTAGLAGWVEIHVEVHVEGEAASYRSGQSLIAIGQVTAQMCEVITACDNLKPSQVPLAHRTCAELLQLRMLWASSCGGRSQPASSSPCPGALHPHQGLSILTRPATNPVTSPAVEQQPIRHTTEEQDEQTMPPSMPKQQQDWATAREIAAAVLQQTTRYSLADWSLRCSTSCNPGGGGGVWALWLSRPAGSAVGQSAHQPPTRAGSAQHSGLDRHWCST